MKGASGSSPLTLFYLCVVHTLIHKPIQAKRRTSNEVSDEFVIDFVFGLISRGVARRAAPLFARRRAFAADQIAFNRRRAAAGDGGVAPRRRQCAQSRPIFRHAQRTRGPERRQTRLPIPRALLVARSEE